MKGNYSTKNKNAAENTAIFPTAELNREDSLRVSDKLKVLYRYFKLSDNDKGSVRRWINSFYEYRMKKV